MENEIEITPTNIEQVFECGFRAYGDEDGTSEETGVTDEFMMFFNELSTHLRRFVFI